MARADGRIEPGQKIRTALSARAWNRAQDAADIVLGARPGFEADGIQGPQAPYTAVLCKSSVTVARWGILAINGIETAPTGPAGGQFASMPVLQGGTPTTGTMAFGVAVEPIASGSIGHVAVAGVVQCKLDVVNADHKFATAKATTEELQTDHGGSALVIWKEAGGGSGKWGLVRLGTGWPGIKRGTFTAPWNKGSTKTVTDAVSGGVSYDNVHNYFASVSGSGTKACAIAYVGSEWILMAAEC